MKKMTLFVMFLMLIAGTYVMQAQTVVLEEAQLNLKLKATTTNGNNGFAVVYHPKLDLYYTAFGGNSGYALETFDSKGNRVFEQTTGYDVRGMWYNSKSKSLEGNAYQGEGLYRLKIEKNGKPSTAVKIVSDIDMPDPHSAGVYNSNKNEVYHFKNNKLYVYNAKNHVLKNTISLNLPLSDYDFLLTNLFYTGKKDMEIAMFDLYSYELVFFSLTTGKVTGKCRIPLSFEPQEMYNISFCNDLLFVFDYETKIWYGYQVFK